MACDPTALFSSAKQIQQLDTQQLLVLLVALACELNSAGGVGGSASQIYTGSVPPTTPDDPTQPALFYPNGGGTMQQWDVVSQAWV